MYEQGQEQEYQAPTPPNIVLRPWATFSEINFYWSAPTSDGGSPVLKYTLSCPAINYEKDISANVFSHAVKGFVNGVDYTFSLTATNAYATSAPAVFRTVQTGLPPSGPSYVHASTLNASTVVLNWDLLTGAQEATPRWSLVTVDCLSDPAVPKQEITGDAAVFTTAITPLSSCTTYNFIVQAVSDVGYSPPNVSTVLTMPPLEFLPSQISSLSLWLDAADPSAVVLQAPSTVSGLLDKSGHGANATRRAGTPTLQSNMVIFDDAAYFKGIGSAVVGATGAATFLSGRSRPAGAFSFLNLVSYSSSATIAQEGEALIIARDGIPLVSTTLTPAAPFLATAIQGSNVTYLGVDGQLLKGGAGGDPLPQPTEYILGSETTSGGGAGLGELLTFASPLANSDRLRLEGYLAWKWGLQENLPPNHTFRPAPPSPVLAGEIAMEGCLLYFDAASLDETSGIWTNRGLFGTAWNANLITGAALKSGAGNGVIFTGATHYAVSSISSMGGSYTISAWVKRTQANFGAPTSGIFAKQALNNAGYNINLYASESTVCCSSRDAETGTIYTALNNVESAASNWVNVSYSVGDGKYWCYSNGAFQGSNATAGVPPSSDGMPFLIGAMAENPAVLLTGEIGEVLLYHRVLSPAEQFQNYQYSFLKKFSR